MNQLFFSVSYKQEEYNEITEGVRRYLSWKGKVKTWNYHNCQVSVIGMKNNLVRIVLRRKVTGFSSYMKSNFSVNLMMGFISLKTFEPEYNSGNWEIKFEIQQSKDSHHRDLLEVKIYSQSKESIWQLYEKIKNHTGNPPSDPTIFSADTEENNDMIPVIYQPRIDAWKNFLREIHVIEVLPEKYEVTLIFQDEQLRRHFFFDFFYRIVRFFRHKRIVDVENFYFHRSEDSFCTFPGIYSGNNSLFDDNTHFDKPKDGKMEERPIKYYFKNKNHPIIFVNTSNHALAPHDNNHDMWKWEYIPWSKEIPIILGGKSRKQIEEDQKLMLRKANLN